MSLLTPKTDYVQWWESLLIASAGRYRQEVVLYKDNTVEIIHDARTLLTGKERFLLTGTYRAFSDDYGCIHITSICQATDEMFEQYRQINLSAFENSIVLEYFRVTHSPNVQYPHEMFNVSATWHEYFDFLLIVQSFIEEMIKGLRDVIANPSNYGNYSLPDPEALEIVAHLLGNLDKRKFKRVESAK